MARPPTRAGRGGSPGTGPYAGPVVDLAPAPGPAPAPNPPRRRLLGLDVARSLAMLGMLVAHYAYADGFDGPLRRVSLFVNGKAMPLFLFLGGAGLSLLVARSARPVRAGLGRAAVLLGLGLLLTEHVPLIAVVLHFYAAYYVVGLLLRRLPDVGLLAVAAAVTAAGAVTWVVLAPHLPTYDGWRGWDTVTDPWPLLASLTVTGVYPVLPSFAFFAVGMWAGRQRLDDPRVQRRLLAAGVALAVAGYVVAGRIGRALGSVRELDTTGHGNMPAWVVGATGYALAATALCLLAAGRFPRAVHPLAMAGQLALTFYVVHAVGLRWWYEGWADRFDYPQQLVAVAVLFTGFVGLATLWRRWLPRGPLEAGLRAAGPA